MINGSASLPTVIKPFYHTCASTMFRLACKIETGDCQKTVDENGASAVDALCQLMEFEKGLRVKIRKRTNKVGGRRKSLERIIKNPFREPNAAVVYKVAIETEKMLEKHYQLKSGETYVLLSKAATKMAEAIKGQFEAHACTTPLNKRIEK